MKKSLLFVFLLSGAMLGKAQTLTFYNEGQPIENGSEVVSSRYNEMIAEYGKQLKLEPAITLTSSADSEVGTVHVTLKSLDQHSVGICVWEGGCVNAGENNEWTVLKSNNAKLSADTPVDMRIEYMGEGNGQIIPFGTVITVKAEVSAWYEGNEASKISFTLVMTSDPALGSVDEVTAASPVVRAEAGTLVYSLPCESAELSLYSIGGVQALAQHLSGSEGTVSLAGLTAGLYIYRLQGGVSAYGKIIVK